MGEKHKLLGTENFPIQPHQIDASEHLFDSFDHNETEASAGWIVRFMQERGQGWAPFTFEEINAFYSRRHTNRFTFNRLIDPQMVPPSLARAFAGYHDPLVPAGGGWVIKDNDGKYYVTDDFVTQCFKSRPVQSEAG
jgi:hypothetical protein